MAAPKLREMYPVSNAAATAGAPIPKGYYLKARKIEESHIAHAAPCVRETWDWILRQCNYQDNPLNGLKRGQCVRTLSDIAEGLHWFVGYRKMTYSKTQCENAIEYLRKNDMITATKTTRGLLITVCKYDTYQSIENYEGNSEDNKKTTRRQQQGSTIKKEEKEGKEGKDKSAFDEFYDAYDYKVGRADALRAWNKLSEKEQQAAINYIPTYDKSRQEWQAKRHPSTYLNKRTWEDEIAAPSLFTQKRMVD